MKDKKYIMVGAPIITKEIFRNVLRPLNNHGFKPSGGFWASQHISNICNISDWYTYLLDASSIARYKNINESTIFTLKGNANILLIDTKEKILELAKKYPSYHHILGYYDQITDINTIFDFEKLSRDFDGIYVDYNAIFNTFEQSKRTIVFDSWSVNTLLLFNLDCIKEYQTVPIVYDIDNPYAFPYIVESRISSSKQVDEESYEHGILSKQAKELYLELISEFDTYSFQDYDEYLTIATQNIGKVMSIIEKDEEKRVTEIAALLQSKKVLVRKDTIIQNIVLNYLAEYLRQDEERIKSLAKTRNKTHKSYSIY